MANRHYLLPVSFPYHLPLASFSIPHTFHRLRFQQGTLILSNLTPDATLPISANRLALQEVKLLNPYPTNCLSATRINGILSPWVPSQQAVLGKRFSFSFAAEGVHVAHQQFDKLVAQGDKDLHRLNVTKLSGEVDRGTFEGQLTRSEEGQWSIPRLQLNNIRFQTDKRLADLMGINNVTQVTVKI